MCKEESNIMGFINTFNRRATGFYRWEKLFDRTEPFYKINFPVNGQTRLAKSPSWLVNLLYQTPV